VIVEDYKQIFEEATARIADLASGDGNLPIPHISGWTMSDAVIHAGLVFSFVTKSVKQGSPIADGGVARWANDQSNHPQTSQLSDWFRAAAQEMAEVVWEHEPRDEVWTSSRKWPKLSGNMNPAMKFGPQASSTSKPCFGCAA